MSGQITESDWHNSFAFYLKQFAMADDKNQNTSTQQSSGEKEPHGRTHNSQNPELEKQGSQHDISRVDQQEGNMNNGESGGNFTQNEKRN